MNKIELQGIVHELRYWQRFVQTDRFLKGWLSNKPNPELNLVAKQFIVEKSPLTILDVGSGAISILHGLFPKSNLKTIDPLGEFYSLFFDYKEYKLAPPETMMGEEIEYINRFDLVHISNALDHTQNPQEVLLRLIRATKPGGWTMVQSFVDEANAEAFSGFHQWNLDLTVQGEISANLEVISNKGSFFQKIEVRNNRKWFIWALQK